MIGIKCYNVVNILVSLFACDMLTQNSAGVLKDIERKAALKKFILLLITTMMLSTFCSSNSEEMVTLESGVQYIGALVLESVPHGQGEATFSDGGHYKGSFFNGMIHGKGIFTYSSGDVYEGEFEYGYRSGKGKMIFKNGDEYKGEWKADMMHGKGTYTFLKPDGSKPAKNDTYNGQWRFNMMHGYGTYTFANGKSKNGYWVMNQYQGQKRTAEIKKAIGELD